ncbi:endonuclease V [Aggregatibacter actinomycetemcomitans]|uniref:endonuclease V n=1 Tax=Aggregatibacter actinomycetemcomitans TaxID=714 RepID=UPI00197C5BE1|nr:endonuclease V [Aggregatibacter actinomycetemcomitans]MBN6074029.1 endonuclease V [Aggregatibacter actinomycetemcomitans]
MNINDIDILNKFKCEQNRFLEEISLINNFSLSTIKLVAGIDVAYWTNDNGIEYGVCCIIVIDYKTKEIIEKIDYVDEVSIPYIPGFLAFRELPLVLNAVKRMLSKPDLYMFDGNGYLHSRHMGIATYASFYLNKPTIGVAKNYFKINDVSFSEPSNTAGSYELIKSGKVVYGAVLRTQCNVKPIYVSCGNWIDLRTAIEIKLHFVDKHSRLPITTRYADLETHIKRKDIINSKKDNFNL